MEIKNIVTFCFLFSKIFRHDQQDRLADFFFICRNYRSQSYIARHEGEGAETSGITRGDRSSRNDVRFQSFCSIVG